MNRNLKGEILSDDELREIAVSHGLDTMEAMLGRAAVMHYAAMIHTDLLNLTAKTRATMFLNGELHLNTRDRWNSPK